MEDTLTLPQFRMLVVLDTRGELSLSRLAEHPNERGKVVGSDREYVVGWIKRGPTGIIGTNKKDALETVTGLVTDLESGVLRPHDRDGSVGIESWLTERQPKLVTEEGWRLIDAAERAAGAPTGRPRVKLCHSEQLLEVALGAGG